MTPEEAIQRYARSGDAEAFASLVREYQQLVYAACSRRLSRREDVEDAAQQTFIGLARAAGTLPRDVAAWLYRTAQHAAIDVLRRNATRERHESAVDPVRPVEADDAVEWRERSLAIDAAIAALPEDERSLVVEHFLAGRSQRDLAAAFKTSQPTIQRRLEAAVKRLREHLAAHGGPGGMLGASALVTHLPQMGQATVPASTSAELAKIALALPAPPAAATTAGLTATKATAAATVAIATAAGVAFLVHREPPVPAQPAAVVAPPPARPTPLPASPERAAEALARLALDYRLADGQDVRLVAPPFPDARHDYVRFGWPQLMALAPTFGFESDAGGGLRVRDARATGNVRRLLEPLRDALGLDWYEYDVAAIERTLVQRPPDAWAPAGDWVVRAGVPTDRRVAGMARVLSDWLGRPVRFAPVVERRPCLVLRGPLTPPARRIGDAGAVAVTGDADVAAVLDAFDLSDHYRQGALFSLPALGEWLDAPVIQPPERPLDAIGLTRFIAGPDVRRSDRRRGMIQLDHRTPDYRAHLARIAAALARQLGGAWSVEDREVTRWVATLGEPSTRPAEGGG